ncbi:MAG: MFS transporter [Chloroflexota bacterium]
MTDGATSLVTEEVSPQTPRPVRLPPMFGALRYPDYRNLWIGMLVGNIGSWIKMVAQGWLVYTLTDSPFYLGLVGFARAVPVLLLTPVTGVLADRLDRRWLMLAGTLITSVAAAILAILTLTGLIQVWHILVLAVLGAVGQSLEMPSRQSLVPEMVERKDLVNAIALGATAFNAAGVIGPAIAALIIETVGIGAAFVVSAVSNAGVALALLTMRPVRQHARTAASFFETLVEGLHYIRQTPAVFGLMSLMVVFAMLGRPYVELMPVFAKDVLGMGASGLGLLSAAVGFGSMIGSAAVAMLGSFRRKGLIVMGSSMVFVFLLIGFAQSTWAPLSFIIAPVLGFFTLFYMVGTNTLIQASVPGELRGRVASIYGLIQLGLMPLGMMIEGTIGSLIGVPLTVTLGGLVILLTASTGLLRIPSLRRLE